MTLIARSSGTCGTCTELRLQICRANNGFDQSDSLIKVKDNLVHLTGCASELTSSSFVCSRLSTLQGEEGEGSISEDCGSGMPKLKLDNINHAEKNQNHAVSAAGANRKRRK